MSQIKFADKVKTHILYSVTFSENRAVYEIMSRKRGGARETAENMAPACGILDKHASKCPRSCTHTPTQLHTQTNT